ncbi:MAG: hypothetical protein AAFZ92_10590, partial [Pseudomonadota bacterium]
SVLRIASRPPNEMLATFIHLNFGEDADNVIASLKDGSNWNAFFNKNLSNGIFNGEFNFEDLNFEGDTALLAQTFEDVALFNYSVSNYTESDSFSPTNNYVAPPEIVKIKGYDPNTFNLIVITAKGVDYAVGDFLSDAQTWKQFGNPAIDNSAPRIPNHINVPVGSTGDSNSLRDRLAAFSLAGEAYKTFHEESPYAAAKVIYDYISQENGENIAGLSLDVLPGLERSYIQSLLLRFVEKESTEIF